MSGGLPSLIDPLDLAKSGARLAGQFQLADMPRLAAYSGGDKDGSRATADVDLGFALIPRGPGERGQLVQMAGTIRTRLSLTCQRCLQPMELALDLAPEVFFDASGVGTDELDERDIISLDQSGETVELMSLVEDEILLAMPMVPMHTPEECEAAGFDQQQDKGQRKDNPFAKLAELKKRDD